MYPLIAKDGLVLACCALTALYTILSLSLTPSSTSKRGRLSRMAHIVVSLVSLFSPPFVACSFLGFGNSYTPAPNFLKVFTGHQNYTRLFVNVFLFPLSLSLHVMRANKPETAVQSSHLFCSWHHTFMCNSLSSLLGSHCTLPPNCTLRDLSLRPSSSASPTHLPRSHLVRLLPPPHPLHHPHSLPPVHCHTHHLLQRGHTHF